jgi:hypothetical protein
MGSPYPAGNGSCIPQRNAVDMKFQPLTESYKVMHLPKKKPSLTICCADSVPQQTNHAPSNCSIINKPIINNKK